MNYDQKIDYLEKKYGIQPIYKNYFGWSVLEQRKIMKVLDAIIKYFVSKHDKITIVGIDDDVYFWEKLVKKKHLEENFDFQIWDRKVFKICNSNYPEEMIKCYLGDEKNNVIMMVTGFSRRYPEMLIWESNRVCIDIFDEFKYRGINILDRTWGNRSILINFKLVAKELVKSIVECKWFPVEKGKNFKHYLSDLRVQYEALEDIFVYKRNLDIENEIGRRNFFQNSLVHCCIEIRDFIQIEQCLKKYLLGSNEEKYKKFLSEIMCVEAEITCKLKKRQFRDVIIQWIDALPYEDIQRWNGFEKYKCNGFEFKNTISMVSNTNPIEKLIFYGGNYIDDELWRKKSTDDDNNIFLRMVEENGYEFCYMSSQMCEQMIDEAMKVKTGDRIWFLPVSLVQWKAKIKLAQLNKPCVMIIHTLEETHVPMYSANMEKVWFPNDLNESAPCYERNRRDSFLYAEKHISYFQDEINSDKSVVIYMSDHGAPDKSKLRWKDRHSHAFCFLYGGGVPVGKTERYFQHNKMAQCVEMVIKEDYNFEKITEDYALLQGEDYYSKSYCDKILKDNISPYVFLQFRGVMYNNYKLIRYPIRDIYMKMPGDKEIDETEVDIKTKQKLLELAGEDFINLQVDSRYDNTVKTYKQIGLINESGQWNTET